jgi:uncharacterized membrane protein YjjP (DUF1212 family)
MKMSLLVWLCLFLDPSDASSFQPAKRTNFFLTARQDQPKAPLGKLNTASPLEKEDLVEVEETSPLFETNEEDENIEFVTEKQYNWQEFRPKGVGLFQNLRWLVTGTSFVKKKESSEEMQQNLASLARMLILLREYKKRYGVPTFGGPLVQRKLVADIIRDCYASGTPTWVLEAVVSRVAEGLTGREKVQLMLLPNTALVHYPPALSDKESQPGTEFFAISGGMYMAKLGALEQVVVRLASFAGNTRSIERHNAELLRMPNKYELIATAKQESKFVSETLDTTHPDEADLAKEILNLAGESYGLFYFVNSPQFQAAVQVTDDSDDFWEVEDSIKNIFSRLAAREGSHSMEQIQSNQQVLYSPLVVNLFRVFSAAGACALWFQGSPADMVASGVLSVAVAYIGSKQVVGFEERVLKEVLSSCFVGICAGLLAIRWPDKFCFGSIAVASILDYLQGFKAVFGVIEVMTKNVVTGGARLLESILYTGLLAYSIKFGLDLAKKILGCSDVSAALLPGNPVHPSLFPLILPFTTLGWSGLFNPSHADLPLMAFHGMLAMVLYWAGFNTFTSAMCVTFSAGLISRFTGREALGNTFAGLYALTPGTYMVRALMATSKAGFIENVLVTAVVIGLGGWTGTILCSPTILGKTSGHNGLSSNKNGERRSNLKQMRTPSLLSF